MAAFVGKLNMIIGADTSELQKKLKGVNKEIKNLGKNITVVTAPLMALRATAMGVGLKIEEAFRTIKIGTGAAGAALKELKDDFKAIAVLGPQSFGDSAKAIADLNTMTGASGKTLQTLSMAVLDASRMMGTDLGGTITSLGKLLNNWNLRADQGVEVLDKLFFASQATGMGMDAIAQGVTAAGGALRTLGLGLDESIALISTLDKAGLNAQQVMKSLSKALVSMAKEGITDTSEALTSIIDQIKSAKDIGAALEIGKNLFGIKAGADLTLAIREGKVEFSELLGLLKTASGTIADTSKETMTFSERWSTLGNQAAMALEPLGTKLVTIAESYMPALSEAIEKFSIELSDTTIKITALVVATGPLLIALSSLISSAMTVAGAIKAVALALSGPVGATVAIGLAVASMGAYVIESEKTRIAAEDMAEAQDWLNNSFKNASTAHIQSELENLRKELVTLESQAVSTRTELGRMLAFGERGSWGMPEEMRKEAAPGASLVRAKIAALEEELKNRTTQESTTSPPPKARRAIGGGGGGGGKAGKKGGGGGGAKSGKSALDLFVQDVQDRIKYFKEDGNAYMEKIDAMQAKTKPLTDDWKKLQDLRINIDDTAFSGKLQKIQDEIKYLDKDGAAFVPELQKMLEGLDPLSEKWKRVQDVITNITESGYSEKWSNLAWEFSEGLLNAADYARMLEVEIAGLTEGTDKWRARFSELQNIKASEISKLLDSLSSQFESGKLSNVEYEAALAGIVSQFKEFPRAAKMAMEALEAFQKQSELTTVSVGQQLQEALKQTTKDFNEMWGKGIEGAVDGFLEASIRGSDFGASLRKLGEDIVFTTLKMIILKQIMGMFGMGGGGAGLGAGLDIGAWNAGFSFPTFANGDAFAQGHLIPFAKGGVVDNPTIFPLGNGTGLMGEAGPEAIMPLKRDSHGRLGVVASGATREVPDVTVNVLGEFGPGAGLDIGAWDAGFPSPTFANVGGFSSEDLPPVAKEEAYSLCDLIPLAKGGVVSTPTIFPTANGTDLIGGAGLGGDTFPHDHLIPFAKGGVVHRPTIFPMANGMGLMGESGDEAIMPLERDSHGRLGVVASGAAIEAPSVTVNVINESSQPVTATQTGPEFDEQMRRMVVGVILRDQATNGPITQNFRRR